MRNGSILYVDDNPRSRRLLTSLLEDLEVEVVALADPKEALEFSRTHAFDLAVLDYDMPAMTGTELARQIKAVQPNTRIILISGSTSPRAHELLFVDAHFGAGTSLSDFVDTIRALVEINALHIAKAAHPVSWVDST